MPKVELEHGRITVYSEYHEKDLVKQLPGSSWNDMWTLPVTWSSCVLLRKTFGQGLELGPALIDWAWDHRRRVIEPALALREQLDAPGDPALYPFQRAGSAFLVHGGLNLLGDEMGTGKTMQTIDAWKSLDDPFPALVIAPNGVKHKWRREINRWWPGLEVQVVGGGAMKRRKAFETPAHVYVINWEAIRLHSRLAPYGSVRLRRCRACGGDENVQETACEVHVKELNVMGLHTVVADEAHRLFDPHSKWTRAAWAVGQGDTVKYRYALTGTPLANATDDVWGILHFLLPDEFPSKTKFIDLFCLKTWNAWGGLEVIGVRPDMADAFYSIFDPHFRCMPKELVLPFLPPKTRDVRWADMSMKQKKAYDDMESQLITKLDDGTVMYATNQLVARTRRMQFSSSYATVNEGGEARLAEPSNKLDELEQYLQELGWRWATKSRPVKESEPVVVFAESRQLIELAAARMEKHGVRHWILAGGLSPEVRDRYIIEFNTGPPGIMLVVIKAGGEGIDLTRSGRACFIQRSDSMLGNIQAEDRVHRIGSEIHDKIFITDIVAPDTVEVEQIENLHEKLRRLEEIRRTKQTARELGDRAMLQALENEEATIMASEV